MFRVWFLDGGEVWLDLMGVYLVLLESMRKEGLVEGSLKVIEAFMFFFIFLGDIRVIRVRILRGLD